MKAILRAAAVAGATVLLAACSNGMMADSKVPLSADLSGAAEVPPVATAASGKMNGSLDKASKKLSYTVTYGGLSGPAAAAHFHGPAAANANAGVALPIAVGASPITGTATLTDAQIADLLAGRWYVNIHTAANKGGEIRGQVKPGAM